MDPDRARLRSCTRGWLTKVEAELVGGTRNALLGQNGLRAVGAIIFRPDPSNTHTVGIRNISIDPSVSGRYFGAFMLRNAEFIAHEKNPKADRFEVDTKQTNNDMRSFLQRQGYVETMTGDLYDSGQTDGVLEKTIDPYDNKS